MSHQLWTVCRKYNISPNQLYYLDSCREKIVPSQVINANAQRVVCEQRGWIDPEGNLTEGALYILDEFETFLKKTKSRITKEVLGEDFMKNVKPLSTDFFLLQLNTITKHILGINKAFSSSDAYST
jgi:hypothetical protein